MIKQKTYRKQTEIQRLRVGINAVAVRRSYMIAWTHRKVGINATLVATCPRGGALNIGDYDYYVVLDNNCEYPGRGHIVSSITPITSWSDLRDEDITVYTGNNIINISRLLGGCTENLYR